MGKDKGKKRDRDREDASKDGAPPDKGLLLRVAWLAALASILHFWSLKHVGVSLITGLSGSAVVTAFAGYFSAVLSRLGEKERTDRAAAGILRRTFEHATSLPFLVWSTFVLAVVGSSVSVVTLDHKDGRGTARYRLTRDDAGAFADLPAGRVKRVPCLTSLFGQRIRLDVEGYLPRDLELRPWIGAYVKIPDDLKPTPSVLIRVPTAVISQTPAGTLTVGRISPDGSVVKLDPIALQGAGAVMLGPKRAIPADTMVRLRLEAEISGATNQAEIFLSWISPVVRTLNPPLLPGQGIRVEFAARSGKVLASSDLLVGRQSFQELALDRKPPQP